MILDPDLKGRRARRGAAAWLALALAASPFAAAPLAAGTPAAAPAPAAAPSAQGPSVAELRLQKPSPDSLMAAVFAVDRPIVARIEAVGMVPKLSEEYSAVAWLIDAASRRVVWALDGAPRQSPPESRFLRVGEDRLRLEPGTYALYLFAGSHWRSGAPFQKWSNVLSDIADMVNRESPNGDLKPYLARCHVTLTQADGAPALRRCRMPPRAGALIALAPAGVKADLAQGFRLARETELRLVATGKSMRDSTVLLDYGWIERAADDSTVWRMEGARCRHAGGARKNRCCDETVRLPAGDYVARFGTGAAHASGDWNAVPPRDPDGWGLVILPGAGCRPEDVRLVAEPELRRDPSLLARMTCVRDGEHRFEKFKLAKAARVRIDALGERSRDKLTDYGWIVDAQTGETVWRMTLEATAKAGGAEKNRAFTGELDLPAGTYEAHYIADDSHAWGGWNLAPPRVPHEWGMTVRLAAAR